MTGILPRIDEAGLERWLRSPDADHSESEVAARLIDEVRRGGLASVLDLRERVEGRPPDSPLVLGRAAMLAAASLLDAADLGAMERAADRIRRFAQAQRECIRPLRMDVPGGIAGHTLEPVRCVGCYAPGGRYPLLSSVLMTVIPARVAGCGSVIACSPSDHPAMLTAAALAGADAFVVCGGAHAVAALAFGAGPVPRCDMIVGPGNRYVSAAKRLLFGTVGIDMIAGATELLVLADDEADPDLIALDLLAQAEHDVDARPMLAMTSAALVEGVECAMEARLSLLPTAETARAALENGFACVAGDVDALVRIADIVAPEHIEIHVRDGASVAARIRHAGAVFIGAASGEVFGDYGIGPNHCLPTGGSARFRAGLSVADFLRWRTFIQADLPEPAVAADTARLARIEGLHGHAAAAGARLAGIPNSYQSERTQSPARR